MNNLDEKRLELIEPGKYERNENGTVTIREKDKSGEAELLFSSKNEAISMHLEGGSSFSFLCNKKCADGIVFVKADEDIWDLHIIELKKTISLKHWKKVKEQFEGALIRALAVKGLLNINIGKVIFYTAYRRDKLSEKELEQSEDTSLLRHPVGEPMSKPPVEDWQSEYYHVSWYEKGKHLKIQLDEEGKGAYTVTND